MYASSISLCSFLCFSWLLLLFSRPLKKSTPSILNNSKAKKKKMFTINLFPKHKMKSKLPSWILPKPSKQKPKLHRSIQPQPIIKIPARKNEGGEKENRNLQDSKLCSYFPFYKKWKKNTISDLDLSNIEIVLDD